MAAQNEVDDMIKRIQTSKGVQGKLINEIIVLKYISFFPKRINYN